MSILESIGQYRTLLGGLSGSSITPETLGWILGRVGVNIEPVGVKLITEFIHSSVGKGKISSLLENKELIKELDTLISGVIIPVVPAKVEDSINIRSVIKCPHCELAFSIIDAPGVRTTFNK